MAIARAVYGRTKLALFDDSLSALDASTSAQVFTRIFGSQGILCRNGTAVILAIYDWKYLADADNAVVLLRSSPSERTLFSSLPGEISPPMASHREFLASGIVSEDLQEVSPTGGV
ncbi:multidrug resistance protein MDR [Penicillium hordei]|uniref:Multidrug resistance protein MDR n=1 Tax=Penicillium hordei TaxID=40994 RepID=A0AAD6ECJ8_9EURO|nr:multidrug resistance protein MDR [Penicillium hordei]KAJ5607870.1 multidrug resistance protein MDR [Penicillium hordei]